MLRSFSVSGTLFAVCAASLAQHYEVRLLPHAGGQTGAEAIGDSVVAGHMSLSSIGYPVAWVGPNYKFVLLNPGYGEARAVSGNRLGGNIRIGTPSNQYRAALWRLGASRPQLTLLHPASFYAHSRVSDIDENSEVGSGSFVEAGWTTSTSHALLWRGSQASVVNLHPEGLGYRGSAATAVDGKYQVGYVTTYSPYVGGESLPAVWLGSAETFSLLPLPAVSYRSQASNVSGETVVGYVADGFDRPTVWRIGQPGYTYLNHSAENGWLTDTNGQIHVGYIRFNYQGHTGNPVYKATAWAGDPPVLIDLHAMLPGWITNSFAHGIDEEGNIVGTGNIGSRVAIVWKRITR